MKRLINHYVTVFVDSQEELTFVGKLKEIQSDFIVLASQDELDRILKSEELTFIKIDKILAIKD